MQKNWPKKTPEKKVVRSGGSLPSFSYAGFVHSLITQSGKEPDKFTLQNEPLARLPYATELVIKNESLANFWRKHNLSGTPEVIKDSPKPRRYRTTSQRRVLLKGSRLFFLFGDSKTDLPGKVFEESLLEPREHKEIYVFLQKKLNEPENTIVATHLNYLIIRGNYTDISVIFNVDLMTGAIVRRLKILAGQLQKNKQPILSAFTYLDPTRSGYYLESRKTTAPVQFKKLFGPAFLSVEHKGIRFKFHPTSFSQVNESMVPIMLEEAKSLISPQQDEKLVDLYCGYGLFSCFLSKAYKQVYGIDGEGPSIQCAQTNAKNITGKANIRFRASRITADTLENILAKNPELETIILDPPKQGPKEGVIEALCERHPQKVLHIFCGVDQIPSSLQTWENSGYRVEKVVPLDMFPGTVNLEVLVLLKPEQ